MPFKSDKQRKWMHANEPDMANKWEKEEALREKIRGIIKRELEATTTSVIPPQDTPKAFSKSTYNAIQVDDEDDEKNESTKEYGKTLDKIAKDRHLKSISKKDRDILIKISKLMKRANESVNEVRLVGYDKSYLDNAKKKLKVPHEITDIEYEKTRQRGPHDKFVKISYKLKWKPGTRLDTEEKYVNVFYDSTERLKMIGKTLKLKLKESVNESISEAPMATRATLKRLGSELNKASETIIKIIDKYKKKADVDGMVKIWMRGLHLRLKKSRIKFESINELSMAPFSSQEARHHINSDIRDMSKLLGKTSQQVIKIMMDGVKRGKYTAMDISRGIKEGPAKRTHFGEMTFIQSLWNKMREKFRKYSKDGKLS
jgi:hypothetical protein